MDALAYILNKYKLDTSRRNPIEIPNAGRVQLAQLFAELGYQVGAEIGTEAGKYALVMCQANPQVHLYCVDMWQNYPGYRDYAGRDQVLQDTYGRAVHKLAPYDVEFVRKYSMDAVKDFADGSLDFVYIDANHEWPYVTQDIYYWAKKVRRGGIVSGHDFYRSELRDSRNHVKHAVIGYCNTFLIDPWFILGRSERRPDEIRDTSRSWFYVKG